MLKRILILLILSLFGNQLYAQDLTKTLSDAFKNNSKLNAQRASLNASKQEVNISRGDFLPSITQTPVWDLANKFNVLDQTAIFCSFSKVTFGSGGLSFAAAGTKLFKLLVRQRTSMIVSSDKVNQLRHTDFFKDKNDVLSHMKKHAELVKPKFEVVFNALDSLNPEIGSYKKPTGGYFISYNTSKPIAKRVIALCEEAGLLVTPAGSTFPKFNDPADSNIRLAPTFLPIDDLKEAMEVFTTALEIAFQE